MKSWWNFTWNWLLSSAHDALITDCIAKYLLLLILKFQAIPEFIQNYNISTSNCGRKYQYVFEWYCIKFVSFEAWLFHYNSESNSCSRNWKKNLCYLLYQHLHTTYMCIIANNYSMLKQKGASIFTFTLYICSCFHVHEHFRSWNLHFWLSNTGWFYSIFSNMCALFC